MSHRVLPLFTRLAAGAAGFIGAIMLSSAMSEPVFADTSSDFIVEYDQVRLLRLEDKAADVIVGNPSIADVTIQNGKLLAITGKTFGVTNLIILDRAGRVMMDRRLLVSTDDQKIVNLTRGNVSQTYNCAPKCQPVLRIGNDAEFYTNVAKSSENKVKFSAGVSQGSAGGE
ncbi:MAG: pilus assembly protein N-terminal domain-containing protein [Pseudomonadota bacterium]